METYKAKSVIVSRKKNRKKEDSWLLWVALYNENNPHLKGREAFKILEYPNIIKVRIKELRNISFYLAGNDLIINNLTEIKVEWNKKEGIVWLTGKQELPKV